MEVVWQVAPGGRATIGSVDELCRTLLKQRGVDQPQAAAFFEPNFKRDIHDPMLFRDMEKVKNRISRAVSEGEAIMVYGDYDADGITGTAIVVQTLLTLGAKVWPYLPHRIDDGYGLNQQVLAGHLEEFNLLVSVDCGISNAQEVKWLASQGKDVIILDHHTLPTPLPAAMGILHPQIKPYPFPHLSGAGVAWKLAQALLDDEQARDLLDMACIGTVADMVKLTGENRAIVRYGLQALKRGKRLGIRALGEEGNINTETISFRIAPLLNAAGRLRHPEPALKLLLASTDEQASNLVQELKKINSQRRTKSKQIEEEAQAQLTDVVEPLIFAANREWHAGVVGLVAGRLSRKYGRPAIVVGGGSNCAVGSARAPEGVNVLDIVAGGEELLLKFGGHTAAAGFSVAHENVEPLQKLLREQAKKLLAGKLDKKVERADAVVAHSLFDWEVVEEIDRFEPYGEGNAKPVLVAERVRLVSWRPVGKTGEHAKFTFRVGDEAVDGIGFGLVPELEARSVSPQSLVDVLFNLEINEWQGRRSLQLNVVDIAPAGEVTIK